MLYNFNTASVAPDALQERLDAINTDLMKILDERGVIGVKNETKWREDSASLVRQSVEDKFAMFDPTPIFTERRTGAHGDTVEFDKLINTLRVVEFSPRSRPQIFTPRKGKWTISTSSYELAYGIPLEKVMNRQHTVEEFVDMAAEAWVRFYADLTFSTIDTACASGAVDMHGRALRTDAAGSDVVKTELDAALRRMQAGNGAGLTIFGSPYALAPIFDMGAAATDAAADELQARGSIGRYRGARLVAVEDNYNMFYQSFTKVNGTDLEDLIFISSGTPGTILLEKDMSAWDHDDVDPRTMMWSTGTRAEVGTFCHTPSRYHVIDLS